MIKNFLFLFLYTTIVYTQNTPQPAFKNFTTLDGLPSSEVYDILQDSKGYIWFATDRGISRYNGYEFKNYTIKDGLTDNVVYEFYEDYKNRIWLLPMNGKLCYIENDIIHEYKHNELLAKNIGLPKYSYSFQVDNLDTIYYGTIANGLVAISKEGTIKQEKKKLDSLLNRVVIFKKQEDRILSYGVNFKEHAIKLAYYYNTKLLEKGNPNTPIRSKAYLFAADLLCYNTSNKIVLYNLKANKIVDEIVFENRISGFNKIDNQLFVGQDITGGLKIYDIKNQKLQQKYHFLKKYGCSNSIKDKDGGYWISTTDDGVFYISNFDILSYTKENGLPKNNILELETHGESLLITDGNSLTYLMPNKELITKTHKKTILKKQLVTSELFHTKGCTIYNSDSKLVDKCRGLKYPTNNKGITIKIITDSAMYFFSNRGGYKYIDDKAIRINLHQPFLRIGDVELIKEDEFWIGDITGLYKYSPKKVTHLAVIDSLFSHRVVDLDKTSHYGLVVATRGAGIILYKDNQLTNINTTNGLITNNINKIHIDTDQNIWVATNQGVHKIDATNPKKISYYSTSDALISDEITDITGIGDNIYVSTKRGLSIIDVPNFKQQKSVINVEITDIKLNNTSIPINAVIDIMPNDRYLEINYLGLCYSALGNIEYRYRILELSQDWRYTKQRSIQIDAFPDNGIYTIEIMARKKPDGDWSKTATTIALQFHPPFYKTWAFRIGIVGFIILLIYLGFKYKLLAYNKHIQQEIANRILQKLGKQSYLMITADKKEIRINENNILYIQAFKNYVEINTVNNKYLYRSTLTGIKKEISDIKFIQVSRSFIVKKDRIDSISANHITIGEQKIPVGVTYIDEIKKIKNQFKRLNK